MIFECIHIKILEFECHFINVKLTLLKILTAILLFRSGLDLSIRITFNEQNENEQQ